MTDHHDEAEAYRNRAERAEQEAAELRKRVETIEAVAQIMADDLDRIRAVAGNSSAGLAAYTAHMIR